MPRVTRAATSNLPLFSGPAFRVPMRLLHAGLCDGSDRPARSPQAHAASTQGPGGGHHGGVGPASLPLHRLRAILRGGAPSHPRYAGIGAGVSGLQPYPALPAPNIPTEWADIAPP